MCVHEIKAIKKEKLNRRLRIGFDEEWPVPLLISA